jgi:hypothetical protein
LNSSRTGCSRASAPVRHREDNIMRQPRLNTLPVSRRTPL